MPAGLGDAEYVELFREIIVPVGREFAPELVLVSAGFDAYYQDPLGSMGLTERGYAAITREILSIAEASCRGRAVFALEGGYHLLGLERSIASVLEVMTGSSPVGDDLETENRAKLDPRGRPLIDALRQAHRGFWKSLAP
jgi:acetoin utilization deacetylase AcuC-like enzyme